MTLTSRIAMRTLRDMEDFWRVHRFLIETYPITPPGFNWDIRHWESRIFYDAHPVLDTGWAETVGLWETAEGRLVGAVTSDGDLPALQVHPDDRGVEEEMIAWAEEHLAAPIGDGSLRQVQFFVMEYDALRTRLLESRGYVKTPEFGVVRRLRLADQPLAKPDLAAGYTLRAIRPADKGDCQHVADILNAAFNRDFHNAEEFYDFARLAPSFRADLDLVAQDRDGSWAAYVGVAYDEANRLGIFEPVCAHPDHRRKGLARALMFEGLRRLAARGASDVMVETGDMEPANRLYEAIGFTETHRGHVWRRVF